MSEAQVKKPGFPIGLTVAVGISFAILCGLGSWQVQRLHWKESLLARLDKLKAAPAVPLAPVLAAAARGEDVSWTRVETDCAPAPARTDLPLVYGVRDGDIVWRAQVVCGLGGGAANGAILADLGVVDALTGQPTGGQRAFVPPEHIVGVLADVAHMGGDERRHLIETALGERPSTYVLMAEATAPKVDGITPAPLPAEISNRHLEYALTWFGLAVTLLFIYAAMLWRRLRP
ncbi:SURF1 family cytochrome oxidase biogenesis protein [Caulobacter sp.]|uniref:SURF1 family cytochrome oxidase biogenesis protein n=1 Tax=Caulobacter sp. TaxID=78 RepID=UPI001B21BDCA|nr:SURF1 family cytochrome oxidase biogenesis protein [Caulobacter sp.]MBO9546610.1 SURF1 family protein [Caulobacter sp.]